MVKSQPEAFELAVDEQVLLRGEGAKVRGTFGARTGPLWLTSQRLLWRESTLSSWPGHSDQIEVQLTSILKVGKGSLVDWIFGGPRLRLDFRGGGVLKLFVTERDDRGLERFVAEIRRIALASSTHTRIDRGGQGT